jgi:alkanesulfonate monooxygenase SsuD/methylene tetrahydromethanopterin reductase-like flavin-dependent oxidoreductase (luciferase family)
MVAVSVICAPSEAEARWLAGSSALSILQRRTGRLGLLPSPEEAAAHEFSPADLALVERDHGDAPDRRPRHVHRGIAELQRRTAADEIMLSTRVHSYEARVQSLTLLAERPAEA